MTCCLDSVRFTESPQYWVSSSSGALAAPPAVTHLPRAFISPTAFEQRRGEALWERVWRQVRGRWGRPLLSRPWEAVSAIPAWSCSCRCVVARWVWMVSEVRPCVIRVSACALVCPLCVPAPPVSFYPGVFLPRSGVWILFTGKVFISTPRTPDRRTHRCKFNTVNTARVPLSHLQCAQGRGGLLAQTWRWPTRPPS